MSISTESARFTIGEKNRRKHRVLAQGTPSIARGISEAVVIKRDDLYFLSERDGDVPMDTEHGLGLYFHDCRYLSGYTFRIGDAHLNPLTANSSMGFMATHQLTNPDLRIGEQIVKKESLGITRERVIDADERILRERVSLQNFSRQKVELPIELEFRADFQDVFSIRGLLTEKPCIARTTTGDVSEIRFHYEGRDRRTRALIVRFQLPMRIEGARAHRTVSIESKETVHVDVSFHVLEQVDDERIGEGGSLVDLDDLEDHLARASREWLSHYTKVQSDSLLLNRILGRSLVDLQTLSSSLHGHRYFAAGIPWFTTLFGRDSIITALQTLAYDPTRAEETLRLLASYQCSEIDEWRDGQPGKILHELRIGELAALGEIPHTPYFGTIDATPLFLILLERHAAWTGSLELFHELRGPAELALRWIDEFGIQGDDGFVSYESSSQEGLINQGWKDTGDAVVNADGSLAIPPIALVEVQGYVYRARRAMARLYRLAGDEPTAVRLERDADAIRRRIEEKLWNEERKFYSLALQAGGEPVDVVTSNPGHLLWCGVPSPERARRIADRLVEPDMFSGWGIRTLAASEVRYNPIGYHLGTVWPHENSIIAAGFRRYGFDELASVIFKGIVEAAMYFDDHTLPELFAGFSRERYQVPVSFPVACHPQAWAAGTVPYLVETMLGLVPEAFEKRLRIVRPTLPDFVDYIDMHGLRVGDAEADLLFERTGDGDAVAVRVARVEGDLEVLVEPQISNRSNRRWGHL